MKKYFQQSIIEVVKFNKTDLKTGLSSTEVKKRLNEIGPNQLEEKKGRTPLKMLLEQFKNVLVLILLISALVSFILGEVSDSIMIAAILILNATLGVVQEYKAEKSLAALKKMTTPNALAIREGKQTKIETTQLVPGDLVLLESGDHIPADLRLAMVNNLKIQESVLTGESEPVEKKIELIDKEDVYLGDRNNLAFMGTAVISGRGRGIVVATGMKTEMGQIAGMLKEQKPEETPLQNKLNQVGKKLGLIILIVVAFVVLLGCLRGIEFFEMFFVGISLAVAAVPEGLPAVVTVVLALGVQRMIKRNVIVRHLPAVETLGATTVICSDKTGTLTRNQMTVRELVLPEKNIEVKGEGYQPVGNFYISGQEIYPRKDPDISLLLKGSVLCNNAELQMNNKQWEIIGDPTEAALIVAAAKAGYDKKTLNREYPRIKEFPFDSDRKKMSTVHQTTKGHQIIFVKGAPDQVIEHCRYYQKNGRKEEMDEFIKNNVLSQNRTLARKALRVLAVAFKTVDIKKIENTGHIKSMKDAEKELTFLGLMAMIDPPRKGVIASVKTCLRAGIHPIMITGDYSLTAKAIATELGIYRSGSQVVTGNDLEKMSQAELEKVVENTTIFARVSPRHKRRIVIALQKKNQIVAMTGDGVNDAPALKESDIGIAMGITGTDVSKEASDMVLTDDNFVSIVGAVEEGRKIYQNIKKFIRYLISCNLGEIIAISGAILIGLPSPLTPIQILWVNLATDSLPALALGIDPIEEDLMKKPPRDPGEGIFSGKMGFNIFSQGIFIGALALCAFYIGFSFYSLDVARTMAFATLSFSQLSQSLNSRSEKYSIFKIGLFTNLYLITAIFVSGLLQFLVISLVPLQAIFKTVPITLDHWWIIIILSLSPIIYVELLKLMKLTYKE